jgi:hypothetical protein
MLEPLYSFEACIQFLSVSAEEYAIGFHTSGGIGVPTSGVYFYINGNASITANCSTASTTTSASPYSVTLNNWYNLTITVNNTGAAVDFTISDMSGIPLWNDTLTTNIPIGVPIAVRCLGNSQDTSAGKFFMNVDYMNIVMPTAR